MGWLLTNWEMWGALGLWAVALSTLTAVGAALWLATLSMRPHIRTHLHLDHDAETLYLVAVNEGPRTVTLVHPAEADPSAGSISVLSPVGRALLGLKRGSAASIGLPGGRTLTLRVLEVERPALEEAA